MTKPKTKRSLFDTECAEVSEGVWNWKAGSHEWEWNAGFAGINTTIIVNGEERGVAFFAKLDQAVAFSHGFDLGVTHAKRTMAK